MPAAVEGCVYLRVNEAFETLFARPVIDRAAVGICAVQNIAVEQCMDRDADIVLVRIGRVLNHFRMIVCRLSVLSVRVRPRAGSFLHRR